MKIDKSGVKAITKHKSIGNIEILTTKFNHNVVWRIKIHMRDVILGDKVHL
jgi:hypothetical protein